MKLQEIREFAKNKGIKSGKLKKVDLIREIQKAEGNFDCFGSAISGFCDRNQCLWIKDCITVSVH